MAYLKNSISWFIRRTGFILFADYLRYYFFLWRNFYKNKKFKNNHPDIAIPPDYLMYESFKLDYQRYYVGGKQTAEWIFNLTNQWLPKENGFILDWGCGPGRVIRHWPVKNYYGYASDVNDKSIAWCRQFLTGIHFLNQQLIPPLPVDEQKFDFIYGISILTHLNEHSHFLWMEEFQRILKPGGLLLLTTQGLSFKHKLTSREKRDFDQGKLIVRSAVKEGHRTFSSFQPVLFMEKLLHTFEVLKQITAEGEENVQDVWIVRKIVN